MVLLLDVAMSHRGQSRPFHGAGAAVKNHVEKAIRKQESGRFFEKKLRKKLLLPGDVATPHVKLIKVFCGAFLQKSDLFGLPVMTQRTTDNTERWGTPRLEPSQPVPQRHHHRTNRQKFRHAFAHGGFLHASCITR
jgi:hypothetical protein